MHDGDTGSVNAVLTDEGTKEIKLLLSQARYYVSPDGGMTYSASNDISDLTIKHLTMDM